MKNKIKILLSTLLVAVMLVVTTGCSLTNGMISNITQNATNNNLSATLEELKGEDGTNGVDGKDGKDGDNIDLYAIYEQLVDLGEFSGDYSDFVKEYLNSQADGSYATNKALNSVVSVYSGFTSTVSYKVSYFETASFEQKYYGAGSGVFFRLDKTTGDAYIITNYHVVYDSSSTSKISQEISLFLYGNEEFTITTENSVIDMYGNQYAYRQLSSDNKISATFLGGSLLYDIAVLKVTGSELLKTSSAECAYFADSNEITVGESTIAVGNPAGAGISATKGIVSVDSEYISMTGADNLTPCTFRVIRTDTAINAGNSGGGLFNANAELIGIVNAKITSTTIENIGYAIPSNIAGNIAENIIRNCDGDERTSVKRCMLGIGVTAVQSSAVFDGTKTKIVEIVTVGSINEGAPVEGVLEVGDVLTSVTINYTNGNTLTKDITRTFHLVDLSLTLSVGDSLTLKRTASDGTAKTDVTVVFTDAEVQEFK